MPEPIEYKQVLIVNRALKMKPGKLAAQCAHGAMMFLVSEDPRESEFSKAMLDQDFNQWLESGMKKVVLRVDSESALNAIEEAAREAGLHVRSVWDAGLTTFNGVSHKTCVAIGPSDAKVIDSVTGKLELL
jgi:PTH2 family peptidyl-tRNA hydrolase